MTELQFNATIVIAFVATLIIVVVGFTYFLKWRRGVLTEKPSPEDLAQQAAHIDEKFRKAHPEDE